MARLVSLFKYGFNQFRSIVAFLSAELSSNELFYYSKSFHISFQSLPIAFTPMFFFLFLFFIRNSYILHNDSFFLSQWRSDTTVRSFPNFSGQAGQTGSKPVNGPSTEKNSLFTVKRVTDTQPMLIQKTKQPHTAVCHLMTASLFRASPHTSFPLVMLTCETCVASLPLCPLLIMMTGHFFAHFTEC